MCLIFFILFLFSLCAFRILRIVCRRTLCFSAAMESCVYDFLEDFDSYYTWDKNLCTKTSARRGTWKAKQKKGKRGNIKKKTSTTYHDATICHYHPPIRMRSASERNKTKTYSTCLPFSLYNWAASKLCSLSVCVFESSRHRQTKHGGPSMGKWKRQI